ncbi:MAG: hypothetical protein IPJ77_11460 [Planctomycetes bacterium]|nr:hypothetical protein [Planctomycetota bacterium]
MTRALLCCGLSGLSLVLALSTALIQNENRAKGIELNALKEECSMLEAINGDRLEKLLEKDWAPLPFTPREPKAPAHAAPKTDGPGTTPAKTPGRADA